MKKTIFIALLIATVILASCGQSEVKQEKNIWQDSSNLVTKEDVQVKKEEKASALVTQEKLNSTMIDIFKKWKDATCTFKITSEWNIFDAIMYIEWKKLRYTMNWEIEGNKMENNVIVKDWFSYSWTNMSKDWFKMKDIINDEVQEWVNTDWNQEEMEAQEMNEKVEFDCKYSVDSAMFELPAWINFQDFWEMPQMPDISWMWEY